MARKMSERSRRALAERRKQQKEEHPSLRSVGLAGVLIAADWVQEFGPSIARERGVDWEAGSVDLEAAIAEADKNDPSVQDAIRRASGDTRTRAGEAPGIPPFWWPMKGDLTTGVVGNRIAYPPPTGQIDLIRHRQGPVVINPRTRPMFHDEFKAWRAKQVEVAYLKYAPPGASHALRSRFKHKLAFVRVYRGDTNPAYEVNGTRSRLVVCYERELLVAILSRAINPKDVHKYVASPCRTWPVWDNVAGQWLTRPRADVRVEWSQLPTCQPGPNYPDVEKGVISPVWRNQFGKLVVPVGCKLSAG